ncbi:hypothetical protein HPB51_000126 [Rhipicephalus microplus]|uniref:Ig-like domain-containing protein n=1 Tax=Rhipicephalus microplus TaxID=6941 RepID=A0A9J6DRP5_RHIMP|nr:hypothetical protein HPB51_000126 [Rhipicephalus microplus]
MVPISRTTTTAVSDRKAVGQPTQGLVLPSLGFDEEPPERYHFLNTLGGSLRCRGHGLVLPSLGFDEEPPERYHFLNTLGGSLRCRGHGSPSPSLWWIHADDLNGSSSSASWAGSVGIMMSTPAALSEVPGLRHTSADGSTLLFPAFGASEFRAHVHSTSYRCVLSNALGKMASRTVRVRAGTTAVVLRRIDSQDERWRRCEKGHSAPCSFADLRTSPLLSPATDCVIITSVSHFTFIECDRHVLGRFLRHSGQLPSTLAALSPEVD